MHALVVLVALEGLVSDAETFEPIAGAEIEAAGATTTTDDEGAFTLDVPPGEIELRIAVPGRPEGRIRQRIGEGATTAIYLVTADGTIEAGEAIVIAEEFHEPPPPPPPAAVTTTVGGEEASHVAGSGGDAGKVVTNLAGVARPAAGSAALVVWGAAPKDTAILVDGVELPALYHLGGVRSVLATDLVDSIQLQPGAFGADVGRVLGGVVRVTTAPLPERTSARVAVDALDAAATVGGPLGTRVRGAVGARWSWIDRLVEGAIDERAAELFSLPRYRDGHVRVRTVVKQDEHVDVVAIGADDRLTQTIGAAEPASARTRDVVRGFGRLWVRWQRASGGVQAAVTPWVGVDEDRTIERAGAAGAEARTRTWRAGMRAEYRTKVGGRARLALGADLALARSVLHRTGTLTVPGREGDPYVFARPPGVDIASDDWTVLTAELAPNASVEVEVGPVTIAPGVRLGALAVDTSRVLPNVAPTPPIGGSTFAWLLDPRLAVAWRASERVRVSGAVGRHHRAPAPEDLSAVFGNPTLGPEAATCVTVAGVVDAGFVEIEAAAFRRDLDDLATRSPSPAPLIAQLLVQGGTGTAQGVQVTVRRSAESGLSGWLAYTLSRSTRRDHPDAPERRFDFDQPHVLTAVASYARGSWIAGARLRVASGLPRTPVTGAYYESRLDRWEPIFGETGGARLPVFFQLDLRVERALSAGRAEIKVYVELENATARRNAEEIVYSYDYSSSTYLGGLPILAIAGVEARL